MDKELIVVKGKVIEQQRSYTPDIGKDIGYEAGAKMIKRHFDANPDDVIAHFLGRNAIEKILAQPGCVGIRAFHALNEMGITQLILVGVNKYGKNILEFDVLDDGKVTTKVGAIVTNFTKCPPYCGDADGTMDDSSSGWL
jgi:hypothetical protein